MVFNTIFAVFDNCKCGFKNYIQWFLIPPQKVNLIYYRRFAVRQITQKKMVINGKMDVVCGTAECGF
jgi:hypothetical protein